MESSSSPSATDDPIVGQVTSWYIYRRMVPMIVVLLLMGLYFWYDGYIGYPKANTIVAKKEWFETVVLKGYNEAKAAGHAESWVTEAKTKGWPTGKNGEAPRWVSWAAEQGLPEHPHQYSPREINGQFWWGGGCILASFAVAITLLTNRRKVVSAGSDHWVTPEGKKILFADVIRLDTRKWRRKGLAYIWYRESEKGPVRKAILDDLKFTHMARILHRLKVNFRGEMIENEPSEPNTQDDLT